MITTLPGLWQQAQAEMSAFADFLDEIIPSRPGLAVVMGITYIEGVVTGPSGKQATVRFLVDTGATYTLLAAEESRLIELTPKRSLTFTLADGTMIERKVTECHIALPQGEGHTPIIIGDPGDEPLLGVVTLEILGLVLNPFNRTLQPMRMLLV